MKHRNFRFCIFLLYDDIKVENLNWIVDSISFKVVSSFQSHFTTNLAIKNIFSPRSWMNEFCSLLRYSPFFIRNTKKQEKIMLNEILMRITRQILLIKLSQRIEIMNTQSKCYQQTLSGCWTGKKIMNIKIEDKPSVNLI